MIEYSQSQNNDSPEVENITFKVIGVGGAGANVLDRLALEGSDDAQLLVLNTDIRKLSSSVSSQKVQLGATLLKGMGTGGDPDLGKQAAIEATDEVREAIRGHDMVFVCVGLGGGTGSGAAPEVCRIAREEGVFLVAFTTLPFEFEGARRMEQAQDALRQIDNFANAVVTFDNDRMGELIVPKDGVTQAFAAADKIISQSIRATMGIVSKPGIIRIGMDDFLTALNSNNSRCLFGYGQAKGDNRALEAVEQTLKCPLLDNGKLLNEAKNVLIQVSGSDSMTLMEVQTVMKELTGHLKPDAHVLFGTGTDARLGSSLAVTVISSLDGDTLSATSNSPIPRQEPVAGSNSKPVMDQSPLAAAVTAAAATAVGEAANMATAKSNIVPMDPYANSTPPPLDTDSETSNPEVTNPIANAVQEASIPTTPKKEAPVELPPIAAEAEHPHPPVRPQPRQPQVQVNVEKPSQQPVTQPETVPPVEPAAHIESPQQQPAITPVVPTPLVQPEAHPVQEAPLMEPAATAQVGEARVEAQTDQSQTIALSKIGPGETTQRILSRPHNPEVEPETQNVAPMPTSEEQIEEQRDILHLEPAQTKGRFAKGDPTIVDGEDLDVPTFLRKKG